MKRIAIIGAGLLVCAMLTGCSEKADLSTSIFTPTEKAVYNAYWSQPYDTPAYKSFIGSVAIQRNYKAPIKDTFFCDSVQAMKAADFHIDSTRTSAKSLSGVFKEIYGITPAEACGSPAVSTAPLETVKVPGESHALTPAMYDRLITVASSCGRSKAFLIDLTESKEYLTKEDYDAAMQAVMSCKKFELEKALQQ